MECHLWISIVLNLIFISQVSCDDARDILSYMDLEGQKAYKFIYSDLLQKPPQEDEIEGTSASDSQVDDDGKRQIWSPNGRPVVWPKGIVPYRIQYSTYNDPLKVKTLVEQAMTIWSNVTCVEFWNIEDPQYDNWGSEVGHGNFTNILNLPACSSFIGLQKPTDTSQDLKLSERGCMQVGTILHELGHLLGLVHEHARTDRDQYVNIGGHHKLKYDHNFDIFETMDLTHFDYNSIMHYGVKDFSSNQKDTIVLNDPNLNFLTGQRDYLTFYDIESINLAYRCSARCPAAKGCENDGYIGPDCVCVCPSVFTGDTCDDIFPELAATECHSGVFRLATDASVEITSPNYPFSYGNVNCAWLVKGPSKKTMTISLSMEDIPRNKHTHKCYHSIEIRYNLLGQQGLSFCGFTTFPYIFESLGDSALVILHGSMDGYAGKNFKIKISSGNLKSACASNPCPGFGQKCVEGTGVGDYSCDCMDNFAGDDCSAIESMSCGFDRMEGPLPVCMFSQNRNDELEWLKTSTRTPSSNTGPTGDVGGSGSYMYIEASSPAKTGYSAVLDSASISGGHKCFSMFYHMYGNTMGSLYVTMTSEINPSWTQQWMKAGDQGNVWKHVLFSITTDTDFRIQIRGVRGNGHRSDMAIDSVAMTTESCPDISGIPIVNINLSPLGDTDTGCPLFYSGSNCDQIYEAFCNFDEDDKTDVCVFSNDATNDYNWQKLKGPTPSRSTGPSDDVSGGKYYIYTEASTPAQSGYVASLVSDYIQAGTVCVHFQLHMYGSAMGTVAIKFVDSSHHEYSNERSGDLGNVWVSVWFSVQSEEKFKLIIQSIRGYNYKSDVAVDDVYISRENCPSVANIVVLK